MFNLFTRKVRLDASVSTRNASNSRVRSSSLNNAIRKAPRGRSLRLERLEDRALLSASPLDSFAQVSYSESISQADDSPEIIALPLTTRSYEVAASNGSGSSLVDSIDGLLEAAGQNPNHLDESYIFNLNSLPGSTHTIYLDFNGHVNSGGTVWQTLGGYGEITTSAYSLDSNANSFSNA